MKNLEMVLNFMIELKTDKSKLEKLAQETEKILTLMNPEIGIDTTQFKNEVSNIGKLFDDLKNESENFEKTLQDFDIHINSDEAYKTFEQLINYAEDLNKIDLSELEKNLNGFSDDELLKFQNSINDVINNFDTAKAQNEIKQLADEFDKAVQNLELQKKALAKMDLSGEKGTDAYRKLEKEINKTETIVKSLNKSIGGTSEALKGVESFTDILSKFTAFADAGEVLSKFTDSAIESREAMLNLQGRTGATGDELARLKTMAEDAFKRGVGGSVAEAINAVGTAQQTLGNFLNPDQLLAFTKASAGIAQVFDKDINEVLSKSRTFISNFGLDGEKAADLVALAMQKGGNAMDDTLDTLDEYSQLVSTMGFSAEEFIGNMTDYIQAGGRDTDKFADSLKEIQIRINAGDYKKPFEDMIEASKGAEKQLSQNILTIMDQANAGELSLKEALKLSATSIKEAFDAGEISAAMRDQLSVAVSGTMAEDIGGKMWSTIMSQPLDTSAILDQARKAGEDIANALGPVTMLEGLQKQFELYSTKLGEMFTPFIAGAGEALQSVSQIAPALSLLGDFDMKDFKKLPDLMSKATTASKAFSASFLANPIVLTAAAIAGLVIGIKELSSALYESAEEKLNYSKAESEMLNQQIEVSKKQAESVKSNKELVTAFEQQGESAMKNQSLLTKLATSYPGVIDLTKSYSENLKNLNNESAGTIKKLDELDKTISDLSTKKIDLQIKSFRLEANKVKEDMESSLTDALLSNKTWLLPAEKAGQYVQEFLFGTSTTRQAAEAQMKQYTDEIYKAADSDEIRQASLKLQMAVLNGDGEFGKLDPNQKNAIAKQAEDMANFEIQQREAVANRTKSLIDEQLKNGRKESDVINDIIKLQGKSKDEAEKLVKVSKEELKVQKEKNIELENEEKRRKLLGTLISVQLNETQSKFNTGLDEEATLLTRISEAKKAGNNSAELEKELKLVRERNLQSNVEISRIEKTQEAVKKRYEPKILRPWLEILKEEMSLQEKQLTNSLRLDELDIKRRAFLSGRNLNENDNLLITQKQLSVQEQIRDEWIKQLELKGKIVEDSNSELGIKFSPNVSKSNQKEILDVLNQMKIDIDNSKVNLLQLKFDTDNFTKEIDKSLKDLEISNFAQKLQNNLIPEIDFTKVIDDLKTQKNTIATAVETLNNKLISLENEKHIEISKLGENASDQDVLFLQLKYQNLINLEKENLLKITNSFTENQEKINQYSSTYFNSHFSTLSKNIDKEIELVNKKYEDLNSIVEKNNSNWISSQDSALTKAEALSMNNFEKEKNEKIKQLEILGDLQIRSAESIEKEKTEIEEYYQSKRDELLNSHSKIRLVQNAMIQAAELDNQRLMNLEIEKLEQKKLKLEIDSLNERKKAGELLNFDEIVKLQELENKFNEVSKQIEFNSSEWSTILQLAGENMSNAISEIFSGNTEQVAESLRELLGSMLGIFANYLEKYIEGTISKMVLDWLTITPGTPIEKLLLTPGIKTLISAAVKGITEPVIKNMLSFASGGRIESPTLAIVGDGAKLGMPNREWIFNDPQLQSLILSISNPSNTQIINELRNLNAKMSTLELQVKLKGQDLEISRKRVNYQNSSRIR